MRSLQEIKEDIAANTERQQTLRRELQEAEHADFDSINQKLAAEYQQWRPVRDIARSYGVGSDRVYRAVRQFHAKRTELKEMTEQQRRSYRRLRYYHGESREVAFREALEP